MVFAEWSWNDFCDGIFAMNDEWHVGIVGVRILGQAFVHCAAIMFEGMEVLFFGVGIKGVLSSCDGGGSRWLCGMVVDDIGDCMMIWVGI